LLKEEVLPDIGAMLLEDPAADPPIPRKWGGTKLAPEVEFDGTTVLGRDGMAGMYWPVAGTAGFTALFVRSHIDILPRPLARELTGTS